MAGLFLWTNEMPLFLSPVCNDQTFDANGNPLTGGQIETYLAGSSTPAATYTDDTGGTPQSNPIILNSLGYPTLGPIWLTGGNSYKFIIKNALGATLRTIDNISGINDASVSQSEWVESGFVPTYIGPTSFSVPGDQTAILQVGRRVRTTNTSGLIFSTISNSVFAAGITTVTLVNDSGVLDAGLSLVAYGLLSEDNSSIPAIDVSRFTMSPGRMLGNPTLTAGPVVQMTPAQAGAFVALRGYIDGLVMSTAGSSATMAIAAGQATNSTGAEMLVLAASISKTTSAWAVGTAAGGLDTGSIANSTWYHWYEMRRPDTGVVDACFSLSASAPTTGGNIPVAYTQFRRIGSGRTNGSAQWVRFFQSGDQFLWDNLGALDFNGSSTTSATLTTLSVPTGVKVNALMNVLDNNATSNAQIYFSDPDCSDVAPSVSAWPLGSTGAVLNGTISTAQVRCTTNTSAQVRHRSTVAGSTLRVATIGWIDSRGVQ